MQNKSYWNLYILANIIQSREKAEVLIDNFGSLDNVIKAKRKDLLAIENIGTTTINRIKSFDFENQVYDTEKFNDKWTGNLEELEPLFKTIKNEELEHLLLITADDLGMVKKLHVITTGSENEIIIHPKEILKPAILDDASKVMLVHNHPSGNCIPSPNDLVATEKLSACFGLFGISLRDHIVVGKDEYYSIKKEKEYFYIKHKNKM